MSDGVLGTTGDGQATAGQLLKAARESKGLHIAALAVSLKVPVKKLELIEADMLDELPDLVFTRALASSMCRSLKVDATEILAKLPQTHMPRLATSEQGMNTPFRSPTEAAGPGRLTSLSRPAIWAVMALLLAALVLIFLPDVTQKTSDVTSAALSGLKNASTLGADANTGGTALGAGSVLTNDGGVRPATAGAGDAQQSAGTNASGTASAQVAAAGAASPAPSSADITSTVAAAEGIVAFRVKGESWVEVVDAGGRVTLRRLLLAGEVAGASGALPLRVTVGRADQTAVTVRGQPFDGESLVRDNVLRFEVK